MRHEALRRILAGAVTLGLGLAGPAPALDETGQHEGHGTAQATDGQAMMEAWMKAGTPGPEHQKLAEHAGTWKATVKTWMEPGAEPMVSEGSFQREMILDGRVLQETFQGSMMDQPFEGVAMTGYDNMRQEYWSIWTDSVTTSVMVSRGHWDDEMDAYVYAGEGTDPMTGGPHHVKMVIRCPEPGKEVMEMYETHGGAEVKTMEIVSVKQ